MGIWVQQHFNAILLRRWILIKRNLKRMIITIIGTVIFSLLAIIANYLIAGMLKDDNNPITFKSLGVLSSEEYVGILAFVYSNDSIKLAAKPYADEFVNLYKNEVGRDPKVIEYQNRSELNDYLYARSAIKESLEFVVMGIEFLKVTASDFEANTFYNGSWSNSQFVSNTELTKVLWKTKLGKEIKYTSVTLLARLLDMIFGQMGPLLISCGIVTIVPLIITQPITDITGEVRPYMQNCTLTILPYWVATFVVDLILWVILVTFVWIIFLASQIVAFLDNVFNSWYVMLLTGPSFIIFCYCISFLFSSPDSASRQAFLVLVVLLIIPMIVSIIIEGQDPVGLCWVYSFIPHISLQKGLAMIFQYIGVNKKGWTYFWSNKYTVPYMIMPFINIIIYSSVLILIENVRKKIQKMKSKRSFGNYSSFFEEQKAKHPVTEEAKNMEAEVHSSHDYAVRIENASKLFFNTAGKPISAVNRVSLGVKKNSVFGFLGANGAGKTTLIRMITSLLPISDGTIEIDGVNIDDNKDPTIISICPQFNNHLCEDMTPAEHLSIYSKLFMLGNEAAIEKSEYLIQAMDLDEIKDKPIRELSGGDVRKLSIALSFLGPSKIILLDEPTASLDPVSQKKAQDMILANKGERTFMLCTHLLSEAETLCDMISIMVKGCVYTVGSPQFLSQKFGTEYKIDILLDDDSFETQEKLDNFFEKTLPNATLSIKRPTARIYSIPARDVSLHNVFVNLEEGKEKDNGYSYYTCSSSSLERVFMEIVRMSESDDAVFCES